MLQVRRADHHHRLQLNQPLCILTRIMKVLTVQGVKENKKKKNGFGSD